MAAAPKKKLTQEAQERAELEARIKAAKRMLRVKRARDNLVDFACLMMPDPSDPDNADLSRYKPAKHHRAMAVTLEEVEKGNIRRLIITMPPRHGKSELATRMFPAWFVGRDPYRQVMLGGYSETFAESEFGAKIKRVVTSPMYAQVFPNASMAGGSKAVDNLVFREGGNIASVGRGGATTGRGADLFIIDDPVKDRDEANSKTIRDKIWDWYNDVVKTRLVNEFACVIIIMTRWHEDDLVGRLTDPKNPNYPYHEMENPWHILDLPALALENDPIGRPPETALWPERFSTNALKSMRMEAPKTFSALYQGRPSPEDGTYFRRQDLVPYHSRQELPKNLRMYGASDHAPGAKHDGDKNVVGTIGVDGNDEIWIMPDLFWKRCETDELVEELLSQMKRHQPLFWFAEDEHIKKSIGPFLKKRMREERVYCTFADGMTSTVDLQARARSIQGRIGMQMVHFPAFAPWWQDAVEEILKFPNASHDDFVSFLSLVGRGLDRYVAVKPRLQHVAPPEPPTNTMAWIKYSMDWEKKEAKRLEHAGEW
jgi:predicted phage terminase large subunit-like protein